ncbi:hypothetical protein [Streptomyces sp. NPDC005077]|uniref:hypothetical protein n=1 Tax=Streptomyces sp. NPDC005077 TaxID=3154292 RepID=UPI0033AB6057
MILDGTVYKDGNGIRPGFVTSVRAGDIVVTGSNLGTQGTERRFLPVSDETLAILEAGGTRDWALRSVGADHAIR